LRLTATAVKGNARRSIAASLNASQTDTGALPPGTRGNNTFGSRLPDRPRILKLGMNNTGPIEQICETFAASLADGTIVRLVLSTAIEIEEGPQKIFWPLCEVEGNPTPVAHSSSRHAWCDQEHSSRGKRRLVAERTRALVSQRPALYDETGLAIHFKGSRHGAAYYP
jgi:hypothetical protein